MRIFGKILLTLLLTVGAFSLSFAAGNAERGKKLFNDPKFAGGTSGSSCSTCHPNGKGLERAGEKGRTEWKNPGGTWLTLEDANNVCIMMANKGKTIDPRSQDMKDLVAYIKSLSGKEK
ncbi:MAG: hypothetical protein U0411_09115 [Thermodesulfovibrionales bacterium]